MYSKIVFSLCAIQYCLGQNFNSPPLDWVQTDGTGAYQFGYATGDEGRHYHVASATADNTVNGRFGYKDPVSGGDLQTTYTAGRKGFRARGPHIARRMDLSQNKPPFSRQPNDGKYIPELDNVFDPSEDRGFDYSYRTPNHIKEEHANPVGDLQGRYSYLDDIGFRHDVNYIAGAKTGFVVTNPVPDTFSQARGGPLYFVGKAGGAKVRGFSAVQKNPNGAYRFLASGPDHKRSEISDASGNRRGIYTYLDDKGVQHTVEYIAGPLIGYKVINNKNGASYNPTLPFFADTPTIAPLFPSSISGALASNKPVRPRPTAPLPTPSGGDDGFPSFGTGSGSSSFPSGGTGGSSFPSGGGSGSSFSTGGGSGSSSSFPSGGSSGSSSFSTGGGGGSSFPTGSGSGGGSSFLSGGGSSSSGSGSSSYPSSGSGSGSSLYPSSGSGGLLPSHPTGSGGSSSASYPSTSLPSSKPTGSTKPSTRPTSLFEPSGTGSSKPHRPGSQESFIDNKWDYDFDTFFNDPASSNKDWSKPTKGQSGSTPKPFLPPKYPTFDPFAPEFPPTHFPEHGFFIPESFETAETGAGLKPPYNGLDKHNCNNHTDGYKYESRDDDSRNEQEDDSSIASGNRGSGSGTHSSGRHHKGNKESGAKHYYKGHKSLSYPSRGTVKFGGIKKNEWHKIKSEDGYLAIPPGVAVRAHVQSLDIVPYSKRFVSPGEAIEKPNQKKEGEK